MDKHKIVKLVVLLVVLVAVVVVAVKKNKESTYSIVYLTTGEVYVGKLSTFPDFNLKNAYILQVSKNPTDPNKNDFQLNPINEALWAPQALHFMRNNVVFFGPLLPTSAIAKKLAEAGK